MARSSIDYQVAGLLDILGGFEEGRPRSALIAAEDDLPIVFLTISMT
jgi:hypothetical protein